MLYVPNHNLRNLFLHFSRKTLAQITSVVIATASVTLASTAYAQQVASSSRASNAVVLHGDNLEEVVVSGIRFSQRSALDRKKEAGTITDSLVAEDIGAFPDKNIAEALQRIPGIQLERDNGEGSSVSIRGVDPDLLRVEVNNVGALGMGGSRGVDFRDMASELVKSLDVIKGSEARLTEGGIGGTIQVNTRKPNEFDDHFLSVSAEGQYNDVLGEVMPKFNFTGVRKINDDLGVLINITGSDKSTVIHSLQNSDWVRVEDYDKSPDKTTVNVDYADILNKADCASSGNTALCEAQWYDYSPRIPRYAIREREEKRLSANAMVQYQVNDNLSTHLGYTWNNRDKRALDLNLQIATQSKARIDAATAVVDENHNVIDFSTRAGSVSNRSLDFNWDQTTSQFETGFEFNTESLNLTGLLARSTTDQDIDARDATISADNVQGIRVTQHKGGLPVVDFSNANFRLTNTYEAFDPYDPTSYKSRVNSLYTPSVDESEELMAKLDVTYIPDSTIFSAFRFGAQRTEQSFANASFRHEIIRDVGGTYAGSVWTLEDHVNLINGNLKTSPAFFKSYNLPVDSIRHYPAVEPAGLVRDLQALSGDYSTRADLTSEQGNYDIEVNGTAFYTQANIETTLGALPLTGNVGVRVVKTDTAANGDVRIRVLVDRLDENGNPLINEETGGYAGGVPSTNDPDIYSGRKTVKSDYTDVLPSINLTLGLIPEKLELYVGAAKVMARPRMVDINVNADCTIYKNIQAQIDQQANICAGGNPDLDPYRATQFDIALHWYPDENSIVSGAYFAKDVTSWIIDRDTNFGVDFFGDGRVWDVRQKLNGSGVKIQGIELQASTTFTHLPAPFDGLGGAVNYTYMEADDVGLFNQLTGQELPFPSQSKNSYNLTAFYETHDWSIRVAYNYRSQYLAGAAGHSGNPIFVDDAGYLDAKFSYNITPQLKFHADGRNLTSEVKTTNTGVGRISSYDWAGREYAIGLTYKM